MTKTEHTKINQVKKNPYNNNNNNTKITLGSTMTNIIDVLQKKKSTFDERILVIREEN